MGKRKMWQPKEEETKFQFKEVVKGKLYMIESNYTEGTNGKLSIKNVCALAKLGDGSLAVINPLSSHPSVIQFIKSIGDVSYVFATGNV